MKFKLMIMVVGTLIISAIYFDDVFTGESPNAASSLIKNNSVTSYSLDGHRFDVPVNYQFTRALFQGDPLISEINEVESFSISALLPDLEPYTVENKQEFESGGFGRKILILIKKNMGAKPLNSYLSGLKKTKGIAAGNKDNAVSGLLNFTLTRSENAKPGTWADVYVKNEYENEPYFLAICKRYTKQIVSPSCFVRYEVSSTVLIEYRMHIKYIDSWKSINKNINELVKSFEIN